MDIVAQLRQHAYSAQLRQDAYSKLDDTLMQSAADTIEFLRTEGVRLQGELARANCPVVDSKNSEESASVTVTPALRILHPGLSDSDIARHYRDVATAREARMITKEHLDQMGISVAPDGSLVVRYLNQEGQKVTLDLTAIIEEKVDAGMQEHMRKWHGHVL